MCVWGGVVSGGSSFRGNGGILVVISFLDLNVKMTTITLVFLVLANISVDSNPSFFVAVASDDSAHSVDNKPSMQRIWAAVWSVMLCSVTASGLCKVHLNNVGYPRIM